MTQPRSITDLMASETIARIRRRWPDNPQARMRRIMAALKSGYLKVGRLYCAACARRIEQQFGLMDGDYDPIWFVAVATDIEGLERRIMEHDLHLQDEIMRVRNEARRLYGDRVQARTINAWLLVNRQLYLKILPREYREQLFPPEKGEEDGKDGRKEN